MNSSSEDRAYLYGDGLFETIRVEPGGHVRWLDAHIARLHRSGAALEFPPHQLEEAARLLRACTQREPGLWRVTVSRDDVSAPFGGVKGVSARWRAAPLLPVARPRLTLARDMYFVQDWLSEHKTTSYMRAVMVRKLSQDNGFDDGVRISPCGRVGEASAANVLVVTREGRWVTPAPCGILHGVTLTGIIKRAGGAVRVCEVFEVELLESRAVVLTSAAYGVVSAQSLQGRELDEGGRYGEEARGWLA